MLINADDWDKEKQFNDTFNLKSYDLNNDLGSR